MISRLKQDPYISDPLDQDWRFKFIKPKDKLNQKPAEIEDIVNLSNMVTNLPHREPKFVRDYRKPFTKTRTDVFDSVSFFLSFFSFLPPLFRIPTKHKQNRPSKTTSSMRIPEESTLLTEPERWISMQTCCTKESETSSCSTSTDPGTTTRFPFI